MRKNLQQVIGVIKQQLYTSETPIVNGTTTVLRYKVNKVGSIFSGSQSALILNWTTSANIGHCSINSLLQTLSRCNLYLGSHKVTTMIDAGLYLISKLRLKHTADELVDLGSYIYGFNDKNILVNDLSGTYSSIGTNNGYQLYPRPHLQINATAGDIRSYQLQIPLSMVFDLLEQDMVLSLLGSSDLFLELVFDTSVSRSLITMSANVPTALNINMNNSFIYAVYYSIPNESLPKSVSIPYTDLMTANLSIPINTANATQSITLDKQRVKRVFLLLRPDANNGNQELLGAYNSFYSDVSNIPITLQVKYNDEQYFTEPVNMGDAVGYSYTNDCGTYGFVVQTGQYAYNDGNFLNPAVVPIANAPTNTYRVSVSGKNNLMALNFGKVPYSHPLIMDNENKFTMFDNYPLQILLKSQTNANLVSAQSTQILHAEIMRVLVLGLNQALVIN